MVAQSFNLLVLKAINPKNLAKSWSTFGLEFVEESHDEGPVHYACNVGSIVLEIYPRETQEASTQGVRFGIIVDDLRDIVSNLPNDMTLLEPVRSFDFGRRAVILDSEGHKIELSQS